MRIPAFLLTAVVLSTLSPVIAGDEPVSVAFYNLKNYLAMDRRVDGELVLDAPKPDREIKHLIEGIWAIKPDILGVCEIGDPSYVKDLQDRLKKAGMDLPHTELLRSKSGFDRNLAIFSRFPIVASNSRDDYTYRIYDEKFPFQRGVLDTTIQVNKGYELRCVVLHLKSKREVPEADQSEMRLNEAQLARAHLDKIFQNAPDTNLIVMGDFNDYRNEAPVKTLQGFFGGRGYLSSLTLSDQYGFRWTHHWSFADSYSRFDYALLSRGITGEVDRKKSYIHHWPNWDDASDHRPIVISVTPVDKNDGK
ncbi:MAG: endonuclease/exonuclease/phosphatase family protein [Verrucomicrobiales bacterium]|nr:endonuclease/exonuclease/phosphatase family protein [Verrucomicrobiales bacterium]